MSLPRTPTFSLSGKRALVSGASSGLGRGAAAALAQAGAEVTLMARTQADLDRVAAEIREAGGQAEVLAFDVTDVAAIEAALSGRAAFQILVNSAGVNRRDLFMDVRPEDYDTIMGLNVRASFFLAQAVVRRLIEEELPGSIINVSSQMAHVGSETRSVYCTSKSAVEGMTRAMAVELGRYGIRVNTICPTFVETPMTEKALAEPTFRKLVLDKIKLGRMGRVEDIMGSIVFLASEASSLITGTSVVIDGGWTAE